MPHTWRAARQSLEVAGISFDLIIIRIWTGVSTEHTQDFAEPAQRSSQVEVKPDDWAFPAQSVLPKSGIVELVPVVSRNNTAQWRSEDGDVV